MTDKLRSAQVSFKDQIAGRLEETATGGTRFVYHAGWAETIACAFPVSRREFSWQVGVHPFFQQLGAEGWLREQQARVSHVAEEDDLGLLLRYGADCIGAIGVLPETEPANAGTASETIAAGRTLSGVQRKLLVRHDAAANAFRPADATGPAPCIAKFNSEALPTLVRNEHLCLRWLTAVLGPDEVTAFSLDRVTGLDETALIVTRFDRTPDGAKLRAEDFTQILSKPAGADHAGKYDADYADVAAVIRAHSARPEIDLARFFKRLVAFVLVANGDAHLKNFTLLERPEGLRLSPTYDVVNVGVYAGEGFSQRLALALGGAPISLDAVDRVALTAFGERIGLSRATITRTFRDLRTKARAAGKLLPDTDAGRDPFGARFAEIVRGQCLRLLEE
ncbi:MAG TPA: HipA domain-containing protein [Azospirillaceae bacterium]|nr:HipA domain-containing protein [Azospirillaceae bacterium]